MIRPIGASTDRPERLQELLTLLTIQPWTRAELLALGFGEQELDELVAVAVERGLISRQDSRVGPDG